MLLAMTMIRDDGNAGELKPRGRCFADSVAAERQGGQAENQAAQAAGKHASAHSIPCTPCCSLKHSPTLSRLVLRLHKGSLLRRKWQSCLLLPRSCPVLHHLQAARLQIAEEARQGDEALSSEQQVRSGWQHRQLSSPVLGGGDQDPGSATRPPRETRHETQGGGSSGNPG